MVKKTERTHRERGQKEFWNEPQGTGIEAARGEHTKWGETRLVERSDGKTREKGRGPVTAKTKKSIDGEKEVVKQAQGQGSKELGKNLWPGNKTKQKAARMEGGVSS